MELAGIPGSEQLTTEHTEEGRERKEEGKMDQEMHVLFGRSNYQWTNIYYFEWIHVVFLLKNMNHLYIF